MAEVPRIFISATTRDLASIRRKVKDRLVTLSYLPVEQEHFGLHPGTIRSLLREKIGQSDAVVHIVGELYGTGLQEKGSDSRSYTQIEYDLGQGTREAALSDCLRRTVSLRLSPARTR